MSNLSHVMESLIASLDATKAFEKVRILDKAVKYSLISAIHDAICLKIKRNDGMKQGRFRGCENEPQFLQELWNLIDDDLETHENSDFNAHVHRSSNYDDIPFVNTRFAPVFERVGVLEKVLIPLLYHHLQVSTIPTQHQFAINLGLIAAAQDKRADVDDCQFLLHLVSSIIALVMFKMLAGYSVDILFDDAIVQQYSHENGNEKKHNIPAVVVVLLHNMWIMTVESTSDNVSAFSQSLEAWVSSYPHGIAHRALVCSFFGNLAVKFDDMDTDSGLGSAKISTYKKMLRYFVDESLMKSLLISVPQSSSSSKPNTMVGASGGHGRGHDRGYFGDSTLSTLCNVYRVTETVMKLLRQNTNEGFLGGCWVWVLDSFERYERMSENSNSGSVSSYAGKHHGDGDMKMKMNAIRTAIVKGSICVLSMFIDITSQSTTGRYVSWFLYGYGPPTIRVNQSTPLFGFDWILGKIGSVAWDRRRILTTLVFQLQSNMFKYLVMPSTSTSTPDNRSNSNSTESSIGIGIFSPEALRSKENTRFIFLGLESPYPDDLYLHNLKTSEQYLPRLGTRYLDWNDYICRNLTLFKASLSLSLVEDSNIVWNLQNSHGNANNNSNVGNGNGVEGSRARGGIYMIDSFKFVNFVLEPPPQFSGLKFAGSARAAGVPVPQPRPLRHDPDSFVVQFTVKMGASSTTSTTSPFLLPGEAMTMDGMESEREMQNQWLGVDHLQSVAVGDASLSSAVVLLSGHYDTPDGEGEGESKKKKFIRGCRFWRKDRNKNRNGNGKSVSVFLLLVDKPFVTWYQDWCHKIVFEYMYIANPELSAYTHIAKKVKSMLTPTDYSRRSEESWLKKVIIGHLSPSDTLSVCMSSPESIPMNESVSATATTTATAKVPSRLRLGGTVSTYTDVVECVDYWASFFKSKSGEKGKGKGKHVGFSVNIDQDYRHGCELTYPIIEGSQSNQSHQTRIVFDRSHSGSSSSTWIPYTVQQAAILSPIFHRLTLIIGPPGTGKTDVAVSIAHTLYNTYCYGVENPNHNQKERVVLAAQSNLALDQLIEKLLPLLDHDHSSSSSDSNSNVTIPPILRLGSRYVLPAASQCTVAAHRFAYRSIRDRLLSKYEQSPVVGGGGFDFDVKLLLKRLSDSVQCVSDYMKQRGNQDSQGRNSGSEEGLLLQNRMRIKELNAVLRGPYEKLYRYTLSKFRSSSSSSSIPHSHIAADMLVKLSALCVIIPSTLVDSTSASTSQISIVDNNENRRVLYNILRSTKSDLHTIVEYSELCDLPPFELEKALIRKVSILCMTCSGCAMKDKDLKDVRFDSLIVEEAGKVLETEMLPLLDHSSRRIVLIGDDKQLSPLVKETSLKRVNYEQSLFKRLQILGVKPHLLNKQGRAASQICDLYRWRYDGLEDLRTGVEGEGGECESESEYYGPSFTSTLPARVQFLDVEDPDNQEKVKREVAVHNVSVNGNMYDHNHETSIHEAQLISVLVRHLVYTAGMDLGRITLLSPYRRQVALLKACIKDIDGNESGVVSVHTTDEYQGMQNDIVIVSLVNRGTSPTLHNRDLKRITVMCSRARIGLYLVGKRKIFECDTCTEWAKVFDALRNLGPMFHSPKLAFTPSGSSVTVDHSDNNGRRGRRGSDSGSYYHQLHESELEMSMLWEMGEGEGEGEGEGGGDVADFLAEGIEADNLTVEIAIKEKEKGKEKGRTRGKNLPQKQEKKEEVKVEEEKEEESTSWADMVEEDELEEDEEDENENVSEIESNNVYVSRAHRDQGRGHGMTTRQQSRTSQSQSTWVRGRGRENGRTSNSNVNTVNTVKTNSRTNGSSTRGGGGGDVSSVAQAWLDDGEEEDSSMQRRVDVAWSNASHSRSNQNRRHNSANRSRGRGRW